MMQPDPTPPDSSDLSREAYALLAQANLSRMRGQWQDATEKCMQVMTLAPHNASAQSLLGDIYDNQGYLDDAIQWYRMALDIQPDSPADRLKLSRLLDTKARQLPAQPPSAETVSPPPVPVPSPLKRWQENLGDKPDAFIRWAAYAVAVLVVLVVVVALIQIQVASRVPVHEVSAPPVVLPALAPPPAANTPPAAPLVARDPGEADLLAKLQTLPALVSLSITISDAQVDPRTNRLTLTFSLMPPATNTLLRDTLLRAALTVAQAGLQSSGAQTSDVTLRCVAAPSEGSKPHLLCVVDTTRAQALSVAGPGALTPEQLTALYSSLWFAPSVPA